MSETKTNFKNQLKLVASLILTFSLPFLSHYQNHLNAPTALLLGIALASRRALLTRITVSLRCSRSRKSPTVRITWRRSTTWIDGWCSRKC